MLGDGDIAAAVVIAGLGQQSLYALHHAGIEQRLDTLKGWTLQAFSSGDG